MSQNILIEIYKIHVEMANNVSERRGKANQFYIAIHSALLVAIGYIIEKLATYNTFVITICIIGILISVIWFLNLRSYRQLNSGKFLTLQDLEKHLPYQFYSVEWDNLKKGKRFESYYQLSRVEQFYPFISLALYIAVLAFQLFF